MDAKSVTWAGEVGYYMTPSELAYVKRAAKIMATDWRWIAARPNCALSRRLCDGHRVRQPVAECVEDWLAKNF